MRKTNSESQIPDLEILVEELLTAEPDEERVRLYMKKVGLRFTADRIDQMNQVLRLMSVAETTRITASNELPEEPPDLSK